MKNKTSKLCKSVMLLAFLVTITLVSCSISTNNQPATAEDFIAIENELKSKFGDNAYYTDLIIYYNKSNGNSIKVTVTEDPKSLKMGQWNLTQDNWKQNSDITIEAPKGTKAADYMFQLGETINLLKLGGLVEESVHKLKDEKNLKKPTLSMAGLIFPDNGDISKTEYMINLKPENGGTTFRFYYTLRGDLIKLDY